MSKVCKGCCQVDPETESYDYGVGYTEFQGVVSHDSDVREVTVCCEEEVIDFDPCGSAFEDYIYLLEDDNPRSDHEVYYVYDKDDRVLFIISEFDMTIYMFNRFGANDDEWAILDLDQKHLDNLEKLIEIKKGIPEL